MEELLKMFKKDCKEAEIRVTPHSTEIKGSTPAVMAMLSSLVHNLTCNVDGITREMVEFAIELGLRDAEEDEDEENLLEGLGEKREEVKDKSKKLDEISEIARKLAELGKEISNL